MLFDLKNGFQSSSSVLIPKTFIWVVPSMVGVALSMVVAPHMVGVLPSMVRVVLSRGRGDPGVGNLMVPPRASTRF